MNSKKRFLFASAAALVIWSLAPQAGAQTELGSEWTYQGLLKLSSDPLNDTADFEFTLWDADVDGNMIGSTVAVNNVPVVDGLFTTPLDFGVNALNGDKRWLQIAVRSPAGGGVFTTLDPRQALTGVPYAIQTRGIFVSDRGHVGIGTTNPVFELQVVGPQNGASFSVFDFAGGGGTRLVAALEGNGMGPQLRFLGVPEVPFVQIGQNADGNFHADDNRLVVVHDTGHVGIGTTSPTTELDVVGTVTATEFVGGGAGLTGISGGDPSYGSSGGSPDNAAFVDDGGNVGIGTITPGAKLHVSGGDILADRGAETGTLSRSLVLGGARTLEGNPYAMIEFQNFDLNSGELQYIGAAIRSHNDGNENAGDLRFYTNSDAIGGDPPTERIRIDRDGNVGIGTTTPGAKLQVVDTDDSQLPDIGQFLSRNLTQGIGIGHNRIEAIGSNTNQNILLLPKGTGNVGIGTTTPSAALDVVGATELNGDVTINSNLTVDFDALFVDGAAGRVGIGTTTPGATLEVAATGSNANIILQKDDNTFGANIVLLGSGTQYNFGTPDGDRLRIWNSSSGEVFTIRPSGNVGIRVANPSATLDVVGTTELNGAVTINGDVETNGQLAANCVLINGGCDLAEPFEVSGASVEPGMLVSIDPENSGQLRLTRNAYDTMVAGVVSGAGGLNVGMTLSQEGRFDRGQPVALVGRVYAWCDASHGPIRPGDLLTSSDTPGHAMRATDRQRASGAMIGKAMSPLKSGKGLVLVLVNLQ